MSAVVEATQDTLASRSTAVAQQCYRYADELYALGSRTKLSFPCQFCSAPIATTEPFAADSGHRLDVIRDFFSASISIFKQAIQRKRQSGVARWLLNDLPTSLGRTWHLGLPEEAFTQPLFFRTDETSTGKILELQCPGSGWGDLELLRKLYLEAGIDLAEDVRARLDTFRPADLFAEEVQTLLRKESPSILHLLDNSSVPGSMKYFMGATSPPLKYWGYDDGVEYGKCDLIRSHSFYGLVAENLFLTRLNQAHLGIVKFDLPPIALFDQKAPLALPFWERTRSLFSNEVREAIVYSYPLTPEGFRDEHGEWISFDQFERLPRDKRRYFAKYAGVDVSQNWGSRAVYRLSDKGYKETLKKIRQELAIGRPWLIQPDKSSRLDVSYVQRRDMQIVQSHLYVKYSRFYGPTRLIGTRAMFRATPKVHGQKETATGLVI